ncbi:unnamed protein product [Didymodactylos carnosus]|uniref:Uncharacterized protein n=1 Tax=Didymodactylos carnosus TaxID=1234261 RepID=A0A813XZ51_9BILA|nr:unnamed protein product [Didymodactylos carnosus]CAF1135932.1 unnamed protein product [Didymodactylos carnosus]CAF3662255.1 unnamed protein product [Didymodactylos carnosus]CAF3924858.1 unnamed protein product [Didymodactylos carnosus]
MATTIDIDITDIIQNNPLLDEAILSDIIKKFDVLIPNTDEFESFDSTKIIGRQLKSESFKPLPQLLPKEDGILPWLSTYWEW